MQKEKRTREVSFNVFFFLILVAVGGFIAAAAMLIALFFIWSFELLFAGLLTVIGSIGYFCSLGVLHIKPSKDDAVKKPKKSKKGFEIPTKEDAYTMVKSATTPPDIAADLIGKIYDAAPRSEVGARVPIMHYIIPQIKSIGQALHDAGGLAAMKVAFDQVASKNPNTEVDQVVKMTWHGIGEWKGI
jgi:hypothetical protein